MTEMEPVTAGERKTYVFAGVIAVIVAIALLTDNLDGLVALATTGAGLLGTLFLKPIN